MGPLLPNTTAFDYIFLTNLGFVVIAMLVTVLIKGQVKAERVDGGANACGHGLKWHFQTISC